MKNLIYPSFLLILVLALSASTKMDSSRKLSFKIKMEGLENQNLLKNGVSPSDLTNLTLYSNHKKISIEEFEIVLARGKRGVEIPNKTVMGNSLNIEKYGTFARPGDRFVIKINKINGTKKLQLSSDNRLITLPIR